MSDCSESLSDVACLRRQIELECEALNRALTDYAMLAKHEIIARRHHTLSSYQEQLVRIVGAKMALEISVNIYDQKVKPEKKYVQPAGACKQYKKRKINARPVLHAIVHSQPKYTNTVPSFFSFHSLPRREHD